MQSGAAAGLLFHVDASCLAWRLLEQWWRTATEAASSADDRRPKWCSRATAWARFGLCRAQGPRGPLRGTSLRTESLWRLSCLSRRSVWCCLGRHLGPRIVSGSESFVGRFADVVLLFCLVLRAEVGRLALSLDRRLRQERASCRFLCSSACLACSKVKGAHILLGPTVNLQRHPLGGLHLQFAAGGGSSSRKQTRPRGSPSVAGRNFECFSEDPQLSAALAAAYIEGVQARNGSAA